MVKIKIIVGSVRPNRFGIQPAAWMNELAQKHKEAQFELIDLKDVNLPFLDEPVPPAMDQYQNEHTKKWSKVIDESDGFIFITPEYNHSFPASLKNAIDFLAREWGYKPVSFVSYGAQTGGSRAIEQLRQVVAHLRMYDLSEHIVIPDYWNQLNTEQKFVPTEAQNEQAEKVITGTVFWAEQMKNARKLLAKAS
ncbi:NAD(P)H-dependent oxidoreductase [Patescibacteria group bacterium]|nr:NAD(P)H-dependent oxidoreductase [Patescibacteria group bacterium]